MSKPPLDILASRAGIERVYRDQFGAWRNVPDDVIEAIAAAMRIESEVTAASPALALEPISLAIGKPRMRVVVPPHTRSLRWEVTNLSDGRQWSAEETLIHADAAADKSHPVVHLPDLPVGYYRLRVQADGIDPAEGIVLVPPAKAFMPDWLREGGRVWGFAVQLYSLRREGDWGIGDFTALSAFVRRAAAAGAATVGLNPLHALYLDDPERASPYSPSSRFYLNPLYIDVERVLDFAEAEEFESTLDTIRPRIEALGREKLVDYRSVADMKRHALALAYARFRSVHRGQRTPRDLAFEDFLEAQGAPLRDYCRFVVLREHFGASNVELRDWRRWPAAYQDPQSPEVAAFAQTHRGEVEFVAYMQWLAAEQFAGAAAVAAEAGLTLGLYRDLAVGVDPAGADAWTQQSTLVSGWSVGAPPDAWNRLGQKWGLLPMAPAALRHTAYRDFIRLAQANMRDTGILRIDHVLGLWRAFWVRECDPPARGAYVRYPFDELAAVLAIESVRSRCVVVGEDLGTLPDGLHDGLRRWGILSTRLLYFEQDARGNSRPASDYERDALISVGTHDLPPFAAYWRGDDLALKDRMNQFEDATVLAKEQERRAQERASISAVISPAIKGMEEPPTIAAYRFLASTPSLIVMVQIEDALGLSEQVNLPGTFDEYPNWRHRLPCTVGTLFENPRVQALCAVMREARPSQPRSST